MPARAQQMDHAHTRNAHAHTQCTCTRKHTHAYVHVHVHSRMTQSNVLTDVVLHDPFPFSFPFSLLSFSFPPKSVPIPDDVQKKLDGKLINFVGYEFDIIRVLDNGTERSAHAWYVNEKNIILLHTILSSRSVVLPECASSAYQGNVQRVDGVAVVSLTCSRCKILISTQ